MRLMKAGLKAAIAVKTADVIDKRVLERQQAHAAAQGHAPPAAQAGLPVVMPASEASASRDMAEKLAQLEQLGDLRASRGLTDTAFEVQQASSLSACSVSIGVSESSE